MENLNIITEEQLVEKAMVVRTDGQVGIVASITPKCVFITWDTTLPPVRIAKSIVLKHFKYWPQEVGTPAEKYDPQYEQLADIVAKKRGFKHRIVVHVGKHVLLAYWPKRNERKQNRITKKVLAIATTSGAVIALLQQKRTSLQFTPAGYPIDVSNNRLIKQESVKFDCNDVNAVLRHIAVMLDGNNEPG